MSGVFQSILKGSVVIAVSRAVLKIFSAISYFLVLRELSVGSFGVVSLALSVSGPALAICGLGLDDMVISQAARSRGAGTFDAFKGVLRGYAAFRFAALAFLLAGVVGFAPLLSDEYQDVFRQFQLPLLCWIALNVLRVLVDGLQQMQERFGVLARANVIETFSRMVVVFALFASHRIDVPNVIWSYVAAKAVGTAVLLPGLAVLGGGAIRSDVVRFYRFVVEGGTWEILRNFTGSLFSSIDQWIVGIFLGAESVGLLSFASSLNSLLAQALPFRQVLFPILSRLSNEARTSSFVSRRIAKYSAWLNTAVVLAAAIAAPYAVAWFMPGYREAVPVFQFLSVAQIMSALTVSHGSLLYALKEQRFLFGIGLLSTASALTVLPLLTRSFGVMGAVAERHISSLVTIALRERRLRRQHGIVSFDAGDLLVFDDFDRRVVGRLRDVVRTRSLSV
jgi:O-antigen/teichoic acid export membrane protein